MNTILWDYTHQKQMGLGLGQKHFRQIDENKKT